MGYIKVRFYVTKREKSGRVRRYWQPQPAGKYKPLGILPRRLHDDEAEALQQCKKYNDELDAFLKGKAPAPIAADSIEWLIATYKKDSRFKDLAYRTQTEYGYVLNVIEKAFNGITIQDVDRGMARELYSAFHDKPRKAQDVVKIARILWNVAIDHGKVTVNPFAQMKIKGRPPREIVWEKAEIAAFMAKAVEMGRPSMELACLMGGSIGPNTGDCRLMPKGALHGDILTFKRRKTYGKVFTKVVIPLADLPHLKAKIKAMLTKGSHSTVLIGNESTGKPYTDQQFGRVFREIADAAGIPHEKQFKDLRRTAVITLAEAGATPQEIAAITGWKIDYCVRIINTYCPVTLPMAQNALAKLREKEKGKA